MSDRELLEMAAKAAGYDGLRWSMLRQCFYDCSGIYWRPLDDDGDALRLAVKLQLQIRPNGYDVMVVARLPSHIAIADASCTSTVNNDFWGYGNYTIYHGVAPCGACGTSPCYDFVTVFSYGSEPTPTPTPTPTSNCIMRCGYTFS